MCNYRQTDPDIGVLGLKSYYGVSICGRVVKNTSEKTDGIFVVQLFRTVAALDTIYAARG